MNCFGRFADKGGFNHNPITYRFGACFIDLTAKRSDKTMYLGNNARSASIGLRGGFSDKLSTADGYEEDAACIKLRQVGFSQDMSLRDCFAWQCLSLGQSAHAEHVRLTYFPRAQGSARRDNGTSQGNTSGNASNAT
jgi:hypothetical protein